MLIWTSGSWIVSDARKAKRLARDGLAFARESRAGKVLQAVAGLKAAVAQISG
jgi:hypothetical protein